MRKALETKDENAMTHTLARTCTYTSGRRHIQTHTSEACASGLTHTHHVHASSCPQKVTFPQIVTYGYAPACSRTYYICACHMYACQLRKIHTKCSYSPEGKGARTKTTVLGVGHVSSAVLPLHLRGDAVKRAMLMIDDWRMGQIPR